MATTSMRGTAPEEGQNAAAGIGLMMLGIFSFSLNDALGKWLAEQYPASQVLLFRSIAALIVLLPIVARQGFRQIVAPVRPRLQLIRAVLAAVETGMFYVAVAYLPLADTMTYYLAGPIYVTLLAAIFLREQVGWRRWTAVIVGFLGVVLALRPSAASLSWPTLIALAGSLIYAVFLTITRSLRGTPDSVMALWQLAAALVIGVVAAPFTWTPFHRWYDVGLLALLGVVALFAIICINRSLSLAQASVVVPFQYSMIIWAIVFGYVFFGDVPHWLTLAGAAVIIGAGLFIFFREQTVTGDPEKELVPER